MYHAGIGTFLQRDPLPLVNSPTLGYSHEAVTEIVRKRQLDMIRQQDVNLYEYVEGDPINYVDPEA